MLLELKPTPTQLMSFLDLDLFGLFIRHDGVIYCPESKNVAKASNLWTVYAALWLEIVLKTLYTW